MATAPSRAILNATFRGALDALYPPACVACSEETDEHHGLCGDCWREAAFIAGAVCNRCGTPIEDGAEEADICDSCLHAPPAFARGRAAMVYEGAGRRMVLALKHGDRLDLAKPMARWMLRAAGRLAREADLVAPVPLHWTRLMGRRFNQSAELARGLADLAGVRAIPDLLRRTRITETQDGKTRDQRHANLADAIAVRPRWARLVAGARVLLVDDVMTTGATLSACAEALRAAGAAHVDAVVFARVARQPDAPIYGAVEHEADDETG